MRTIRYGLRALARRRREAILPVLTTAGGAALLTAVLGSFPAIRHQAASFGDPGALARTTVEVSVLVVLVGAVEVAICAMRSVNQRRGEIGVLTANGVAPRSVLISLAIEPSVSAIVGGALGAVIGGIVVAALRAGGSLTSAAPWLVVRSGLIALLLCTVASALASVLPILRAARKPPLVSLNARS